MLSATLRALIPLLPTAMIFLLRIGASCRNAILDDAFVRQVASVLPTLSCQELHFR
jgi:hypothetical protein